MPAPIVLMGLAAIIKGATVVFAAGSAAGAAAATWTMKKLNENRTSSSQGPDQSNGA